MMFDLKYLIAFRLAFFLMEAPQDSMFHSLLMMNIQYQVQLSTCLLHLNLKLLELLEVASYVMVLAYFQHFDCPSALGSELLH